MEKQLENYLHRHIPISKAMGITVAVATKDKVVLEASFRENINHKQTVFGGSLHAAATLACWSLLHLNLKSCNETFQIVITHSETEFKAPVADDFAAVCLKPDPADWNRFVHMLERKKRARIRLTATIEHAGRVSVNYHATFAALDS
jgi:thioesterase domain-containing protein